MPEMNRFIATILVLPVIFTISLALANDNANKREEYHKLYSMYENGAHNPELYLRLAELAPDTVMRLAFLRQARNLSPSQVSMKKIQRERELLGSSLKNPEETPLWHYLLIYHYLPLHVFDYFLSGFFSLLIAYSIFACKNHIRSGKLSKMPGVFLAVFTVLVFQRVFIQKIAGDRYIIPQSRSEFSLKEGVVIRPLAAYSAPSSRSQETIMFAPGTEIILFPSESIDSWIPVQETGKRKGWIQQNDSVFVLKK
jgi:hypothetical protein